MSNFAIFRCAKLKRGSRGAGTFGKALRHLSNHSKSAEISRGNLSRFNVFKAAGDYSHIMEISKQYEAEHNKHSTRAMRSDASIAVELLFSYSPTPENQSPEYAKKFEAVLLDFCKKELPHLHIVVVARHMDEASNHWHIIGLPYDKDLCRYSAKHCLGGPKEMQHLQSRFAEYVSHLGLQRGISKTITKSTHKTKQEHNRIKLVQQQQEKQNTIREAHRALEDIFSER